MAQTFSQSLTGINAGTRYTAKTVQVGDADIAGNAAAQGNVSFVGAQQGAMMRGDMILCKNPDGSQSYYTIDAERSIPGQSLVMKPVGP
jgi:hypothetical protein